MWAKRMVLGLWLLLWAPPAYGQLSVDTIDITEDDRILTLEDLRTAFNAAGCACNASLQIVVAPSGSALAEGTFQIVSGQSCITGDDDIDVDCEVLYSKSASSLPATIELNVDVQQLSGGCDAKEENRNLFAVFDDGDDGSWTVLNKLEYTVDTEPPFPPQKQQVIPGETLAEVSFVEPDTTEADLQYQVLCRTSTTQEAVADPAEPGFDTPASLCGQATSGPDPGFACSEAQVGAASVTVLGLENYTEYTFSVVSIDLAGNPSSETVIGNATPAPEEDLWERYKAAQGSANGEHCFVATAAFGDYDHPQVKVLRRFRDTYLMPTDEGRWLVGMYYQTSPKYAAMIADSDDTRALARFLLWPVTWAAQLALHPPLAAVAGLGLIGLVATGWRRRGGL